MKSMVKIRICRHGGNAVRAKNIRYYKVVGSAIERLPENVFPGIPDEDPETSACR